MEQNSRNKDEEYNDGLEQTVTVWPLTMDCCSKLKRKHGNCVKQSAMVLNPSRSKLVDKTGSRGKIWNYFAARAHKNKCPVDILEFLIKSCYKALKVRCSHKIHEGKV